MKIRRQKGEKLYEWVDRFCKFHHLTGAVAEGVREISRESYIEGARVEQDISKKFKGG